MFPNPSQLTESEILSTTFRLDRTDIYKRFRCIVELHTGEKQQNGAKCFFVGKEYDLNSDNLSKMDIQNFKTKLPRYFYSEAWKRKGRKAKEITSDFPLVFITAGDRTYTPDSKRKRSSYQFDFCVFDLMYYDRNNAKGNETSLREKEDIWKDTERIAEEILEAYKTTDDTKIYNLCFAGEYLELPEDVSTWTPDQLSRAKALIKRIMISKNFSCQVQSFFMPFQYKHNKRLSGVHTVVSTDIFTGCVGGTFEQKIC